MEVSIKKLALVTGLSLGLLALPVAYGEGENDGMTVLMNGNFVTADPENIKWVPNKSVPYGMQMVLLYGNPSQPGPYIFRAKMPSGYKLPPHKHPDERTVTVLKGTYWAGVGERYNPMTMKEFLAGAYYITMRTCRTTPGPAPRCSSRRPAQGRSRSPSSTSIRTTIQEHSDQRTVNGKNSGVAIATPIALMHVPITVRAAL